MDNSPQCTTWWVQSWNKCSDRRAPSETESVVLAIINSASAYVSAMLCACGHECILQWEFNFYYLFQTHNVLNIGRSWGNCHYVIATPILHTLAMMAESASNLTLPSWLSHTQGPPTVNNSRSPHMYLDSLLISYYTLSSYIQTK